MFKRVLVPLDGSARAERALPVAEKIARAVHGSIILLQVVRESADLYWMSLEASQGMPDALEARREGVKRYLAQLAASETLAGVGVVTEVVDGIPAEAILSVADAQKADLIVMCSHGYTGFKRWVLGSVAHKVAWHSTTPVLILHEGNEKLVSLSPDVGYPVRAVVALDGMPFTEAALMPAAHLVAACSAPALGELHLTHLVKLLSAEEEMAYERLGIATDRRQAALYHADHYLQGVKERLTRELAANELAVDITWSVEECTDVAEALLMIAQGEGEGTHTSSGLIALTTHGRTGLDRWVKGSVAERVLSSTTMPLMVVHPRQLSLSFASHISESGQVAPS
jgi:nucleotide-binding universal stress UspA family protein